MSDDTLYEKTLKLWGLPAQLDMTIEECAELIVAINHMKRKRKDSDIKFIEEVVDVEIMINQMKAYIFNENKGVIYEKIKREKLMRIKIKSDEYVDKLLLSIL